MDISQIDLIINQLWILGQKNENICELIFLYTRRLNSGWELADVWH